MAYFYPHIKGFNTSAGSNYYTWIDLTNTADPRPQLFYGGTDSVKASAINYGAFVVTGYENTFISTQSFASGLNINSFNVSKVGSSLLIKDGNTNIVSFSTTQVSFYSTITTPSLSATNVSASTITTSTITATSSCTAAFFNATSDERAKEDKHLLDLHATALIEQTPVYSFKYKDSQQPAIGIMAQDLVDCNIGDFSFVDNEEATGKDGDYMKLKESKLTYVLWKAVQELEQQIRGLQLEVFDLKMQLKNKK